MIVPKSSIEGSFPSSPMSWEGRFGGPGHFAGQPSVDSETREQDSAVVSSETPERGLEHSLLGMLLSENQKIC